MSEVLFWIDTETTGLNPFGLDGSIEDELIELGIVVTDEKLNVAAQRSWVIRLGDGALAKMLPNVLTMHGSSGLLEEARKTNRSVAQVEDEALRFVISFNKRGESPICGSTIGFDRDFLKVYMPKLHEYFHYRSVDVSTVKNLARFWYPALRPWADARDAQGGHKSVHRVLPDLQDSIAELRYYRNHIFVATAAPERKVDFGGSDGDGH